jgi:hypothetical protein
MERHEALESQSARTAGQEISQIVAPKQKLELTVKQMGFFKGVEAGTLTEFLGALNLPVPWTWKNGRYACSCRRFVMASTHESEHGGSLRMGSSQPHAWRRGGTPPWLPPYRSAGPWVAVAWPGQRKTFSSAGRHGHARDGSNANAMGVPCRPEQRPPHHRLEWRRGRSW